ncbi:Methylated-DNA-[protein]-cysteine S-methyltransferase [hydrothermal vent metagenome]|uniref:Methylated-DNA-[protein]-cysteine S-methyltransferase n=1 Tax=hydrothermal vent metagenome TaxID=652676 RepID=A0A3B0TD08_9ZZZZ
MSNFFEQVYNVVRKVPPGRVTSYGAIATYLGSPGASRMVGWAMNAAGAQSEYVPAHRVVNRNGLLTGKHHFDTPEAMEELLENEGVEIFKEQVQDFKNKFWDPSIELRG